MHSFYVLEVQEISTHSNKELDKGGSLHPFRCVGGHPGKRGIETLAVSLLF